ncbi:MAG: RNA 2',3'-cyclic phosphodiesterase [Deltaproteobacteria bacterium]|nr:RNA 2',3'-cyclic phosphodiesterase [Deltaproteobacteria bacterium]MCL5276623.1 RNA 2',3'-cyclic phosphodiesterase [Deltaproteobacteria bacterium]
MIRAFIAIPLEDAARSAVIEVIDALRASWGLGKGAARNSAGKEGGITWVGRDGIHLTLKFLGSIDERDVLRAKGALDALKDMRSFRMDLCGIGAFPSAERPRVLWVGIRQAGQVGALAGRVEESIGDINREDRPFSAHITIGRVRGTARAAPASGYGPLEIARELWDDKTISTSLVDRVVLFQSILGPGGAVYRSLHEGALRKEAL